MGEQWWLLWGVAVLAVTQMQWGCGAAWEEGGPPPSTRGVCPQPSPGGTGGSDLVLPAEAVFCSAFGLFQSFGIKFLKHCVFFLCKLYLINCVHFRKCCWWKAFWICFLASALGNGFCHRYGALGISVDKTSLETIKRLDEGLFVESLFTLNTWKLSESVNLKPA